MSRKPIIAGNWKMHNNCAQSAELANAVAEEENKKNAIEEAITVIETAENNGYAVVAIPAVVEEVEEIAAIEETEDEWIKNKLSAYNKKVSNGDKDALSEFTSLYFMEHVMTNTPFKQRKLNLSLTCPMCIDNIMIGTEGEIHICHKTDGSLPLGNVVTGGYDMEKMYEANRSYAELTNCQECRSCWAVNNCNYCAAMRLDGGRWKNPAKRECDVLRRNAESIFKLFIAVYKQDPQIISDLFLYKNDMNNYTSILDYNEFIHYEYPTKEESVHPTNGVKKDI